MMSVQQGVLPIKVELERKDQPVTSHAGLLLLLEALRTLIARNYWRRLRRALRYKSWRAVRRHYESLALLVASGGRNLVDLEILRADSGLCELIRFCPSSPSQAKDFLYRYDQTQDGQLLTKEESAALSVAGEARIRPEGPALRLLEELEQEVVRRLQAQRQHLRVTLDVDATIVQANKQTALKAYEGTIGYQPQMAWWAEQGVWVADEFRDGNVPAEFRIKEFLQRAYAAVPGSVRERRLRGDSALYNEAALTWADDNDILFAVSADMSPSLAKKIAAIPESQWEPYRTLRERDESNEGQREERQCAEVPDFVPEWRRNRRKYGQPFRYIAIRVRRRQRDMFDEEAERWSHFAVVANMDWKAERLLRWQREKQGTVEHGHGGVKNGLAAGTLPCGRFGSNAAWWRINVITHNVLQFLKATALPEQLALARPKTLRFRLFNLAGRITRSGRSVVLHLSAYHPFAEAFVKARRLLLDIARPPTPAAASP